MLTGLVAEASAAGVQVAATAVVWGDEEFDDEQAEATIATEASDAAATRRVSRGEFISLFYQNKPNFS